MTVNFDEDKSNQRITDLHRREEEELVQILAAKYNVQYISLLAVQVQADAVGLIGEAEAREAQAVCFGLVNKKVKLAARNPQSPAVQAITTALAEKGFSTELYITSTQSLEKAWKTYADLSHAAESKAGSLDISDEDIAKNARDLTSLPKIGEILTALVASKQTYRITRILETVLAGALAVDASDVHFEPEQDSAKIRYRLDGVLVDVITFDSETYSLLISRLKLISGMKLNIKKDSQDGRFSIHLSDIDIEVRASVLPGAYNESAVLRLLNPKSIDVSLDSLGIHPKLLAILLKEMERPDGMILTTGPTGSGKTTTLYSFLKKIQSPQLKIITIEDPIEYHLAGIVQTQVNDKGYNFLEGLRAAVRQDPDIIMVGEIRDNETAAIAINSALTGHMVFSTLHTNDAAGTYPRLIDLGVNPKIITSAIRVAMAQRLARKLCDNCKKEIALDGAMKSEIDTVLDSIADRTLVPKNATKIWQSVGCDKCNGTGFKGRIGIYEAILTDSKIETAIEKNPSEREIWEAAKDQGILTMRQDGVLKILAGVTSLPELERVIALTD